MKPAQAAGIFNTMTDNLALVGKILWAMDAASRGKILGAMNADTAAQVTRIMEPRQDNKSFKGFVINKTKYGKEELYDEWKCC